jgi:hypothetical protein
MLLKAFYYLVLVFHAMMLLIFFSKLAQSVMALWIQAHYRNARIYYPHSLRISRLRVVCSGLTLLPDPTIK